MKELRAEINDEKRLLLTDSGAGIDIAIYAYEVGFFRFNWHKSIEIMTVLNGSLLAFVEGSTVELSTDDVLIINSNIGHATLLTQPNTIAMVMRLEPEIFRDWQQDGKKILFDCRSSAQDRNTRPYATIRRNMGTIYHELSINQKESILYAKGAVMNLCATMLREFPSRDVKEQTPTANAKQLKKLRKIIQYTEKNYSERINLDALAGVVGMNRTYLSTFFKTYAGVSYHDYLTRTRLNHAAHIINNTGYPLIDIAVESGFSDTKSLNAAFKKYFGLSPNQYRQMIDWKMYKDSEQWFPVLLDIEHPVVRSKVQAYKEDA